MTQDQIDCPPFGMIVFGGTGDLALRKLLPVLYHLEREGRLFGQGRIIEAPARVFDRQDALKLLIPDEELRIRTPASPDLTAHAFGMGRELFGTFRECVHGAEQGASVITN